MQASLQCQACSRITEAPTSWSGYVGPWRCQYCHARHTISCGFGLLREMHLVDRFAPGEIGCASGVDADVYEAVAAYNAYAPRAAVVMIRRALERSCREKGAKGDRLERMISDLHERIGLFDRVHRLVGHRNKALWKFRRSSARRFVRGSNR